MTVNEWMNSCRSYEQPLDPPDYDDEIEPIFCEGCGEELPTGSEKTLCKTCDEYDTFNDSN